MLIAWITHTRALVAWTVALKGRELTAHVKHTRAGLQAIKDWVMTELGNIRGQEKVS